VKEAAMAVGFSTAVLMLGLIGTPTQLGGVGEVGRIGSLRAAVMTMRLDVDQMGPRRPRASLDLAAIGFQRSPQTTRRDPLGDGVKKGAWIGGLTGLGTILLLSTQCDGGCDDPSIGVALPAATALGAGVGALIGLVADAVK
jgi:hypothetical protein